MIKRNIKTLNHAIVNDIYQNTPYYHLKRLLSINLIGNMKNEKYVHACMGIGCFRLLVMIIGIVITSHVIMSEYAKITLLPHEELHCFKKS